MTLSVTNVGGNPQQPGIRADAFIPDQLIAGALQLVTATVSIGAGTLARGTVLGQITATGKYITSVVGAVDGSAVPSAILADYADASSAAVNAGVYLMGEFNSNAITFDASFTVATLTPLLRTYGIFLKSTVTAADPS